MRSCFKPAVIRQLVIWGQHNKTIYYNNKAILAFLLSHVSGHLIKVNPILILFFVAFLLKNKNKVNKSGESEPKL